MAISRFEFSAFERLYELSFLLLFVIQSSINLTILIRRWFTKDSQFDDHMFLALLSLSVSFSQIPSAYKEIAQLAKQNAQASKLKGHKYREASKTAGFYSFPGLEFKLPATLTGSDAAEIAGFAIKKNKLAFVSRRNYINEKLINQPRTVFVDSKTQTLYNLKKKLADDGEVSVFECEIMNPYAVFTRLKFYTSPQLQETRQIYENVTADVGCSRAGGFSNYSQCTANINMFWQEPKEDQDPFDLEPIAQDIPYVDNFKARIGAYINAKAGFKVETTGLFKLRADLDFELSAIAGIGMSLPRVLLNTSTPKYDWEVPIKGVKANFLGYNLSCGAFAFVKTSIDDVVATLPDELDYLYKVHFYAKKHVVVATSGIEDVPWEYKFEPRQESSRPQSTLQDYILDGIQLKFLPKFDIGVRLKIQMGVVDAALSAGLNYEQPMQFGFNQYRCLFPYLYGKAFAKLDAYLEIPGISVLSYPVLGYQYLPYPILRRDIPIPYCLFDSLWSLEGVQNLVFNESVPSVFIHPKKFEVYGQYEKATKRISNQMVLKDKGEERVFDLIDTAFNPTPIRESGRAFVLNNISGTAEIWFNLIWHDPWLFPEIKKYDYQSIKLYEDFHGIVRHYRSVWEDVLTFKGSVGVEISVDVYRSFNVAIQKEFKAEGDKEYLSFHSYVPNTTTLGLITHGYNIPYTCGLSSFNAYDNTLRDISEIQNGQYQGKNPVKITIKKLMILYGVPDNMVKISVEMVRNNVTDNIITFFETYSSFHSGVEHSHVFSAFLVNDDDMINIIVESNAKTESTSSSYTRRTTLPLAAFQVPRTLEFKLGLPGKQPDCELEIGVDHYVPTVVMQIDSKGKSGVKGIVSKIYRSVTDTIESTLEDGEQYGILQFAFKTFKINVDNEQFSCIITMDEDLQPLCSNFHLLSKGLYVINLEHDETMYKVDGGYYISIPIRSSYSGKKTYHSTLKTVFLRPDGNSAMCGKFPTIPGYSGTSIPSGCIEMAPFRENLITLSNEDGIVREDKMHDGWVLHKFSLPGVYTKRFTFSLISNKLVFSNTVSSLFMDIQDMKKYFSYKKRPSFDLECSRCSSIEVEHENKTVENLTIKAFNVWTYTPTEVEDLFFYAICSDESKAYCRTTIPLDKDVVTHIKLPSAIGIIDLAKNLTSSGDVVSGLTDFLLSNRSQLDVVKMFEGVIEKYSDNITAGVLKLVYTKLKGTDFSELSLKLGDKQIPFSGSKLFDDINDVLEVLGIDPTKMNSNTLNIDKEGLIKVATALIKKKFGQEAKSRLLDDEESIDKIGRVVDLPRSYILRVEVVEDVRDENSLSAHRVGVIAGATVGVIAVIAIAIIVVVVFVLKKSKESSLNEEVVELQI